MSGEEGSLRRRTRFLVDRSFQSRYFATWLTIAFWVAFALSLVYIAGAWLYIKSHQDPGSWTEGDYRRAVRIFVAANILFILFLIVLIGVSALLHSHRIAGASYRMRADLQKFRAGQYSVEVRLRDRDFLQELADELNETLRHVRARFREQERQLELAKDLTQTLRQAELPEEVARLVEEVDRRIEVKCELPLEPIDPDDDDEEPQDAKEVEA